MRTFRKVLCILCLAVLVTSSAAWAGPADRSDDGRTLVSWALSALDTVVAYFAPDEIIGGVEPGGDQASEAVADDDPPSDEIGAGLDPNG